MKYRHTITGAIVDVNSKVSGDWELVEEKKTVAKKSTAKKTTRKAATKKATEE